MLTGDLEQSRQLYGQALQSARQTGDDAAIGFAMAMLGKALFYLGEWQEARNLLEEAMSLRGDRSTWFDTYPVLLCGYLDLAEGNLDLASHYLADSWRRAEATSDGHAALYALRGLAEHDVLCRRPADAVARVQPSLRGDRHAEPDALHLIPILAWAYVELGVPHAALVPVVAALPVADAQQERFALAHLLRVQGMTLSALHRSHEAEGALQRGLTLAQEMHYPHLVGRFFYELGLLSTRRGQARAARRQLAEARLLFSRLGARWDGEQTERAMAGLANGRIASELRPRQE